jgi:hypothetical protein
MRVGFVVVGVVLIILAAVLMFIPIIQVASQTIGTLQPYEANVTGYSITGSIPATVTWSSSSTVSIDVATCTSVTSSNQCSGTVNTLPNQTGTSGTFSFNVPSGGAVVVAVLSGGSASITVKLAQSTIGLILLIVGIVLLLVGLVFGRKKAAAPVPTTTPPAPTSAPPPPPP